MSATSQLLKQARHEVRAGGDRQAIFQKYRDQFTRPVKLAMIVASTPQDPIPSFAKVLNVILFVFLILAAISKAFAVTAMLGEFQMPMLLGILLAVALPLIFAIAVIKWEGQVYLILPLLCLLGILRSWMKSAPLDAAIDTIFLLVIAALAVAIKLMVFPHLGFLGVKKNAAGEFAF